MIHLVPDRRRLAPAARTVADEVRALEALIDAAASAGLDAIQIRERDLPARTLRALAARAVDRAAGSAASIIVNDRADVAVAAGAAGVHLRADGPASAEVRARFALRIVGRSTHRPAEPAAAGADYLFFGPIFATESKPGSPAAGLEALRAAVAAADRPVLALGGVTAATAAACVAAGAAGIAGIGLFLPPAGCEAARWLAGLAAALRMAMRGESG
jgi:thiamine-phosphate pyrophosphorylase